MYLRSIRTSFSFVKKLSHQSFIRDCSSEPKNLSSLERSSALNASSKFKRYSPLKKPLKFKELSEHNKTKKKDRLRTQKTQWLKKVDEIKKQNEPKEDLNQLKTQYNFTEENQYEILNKELIPLYLVDYDTQCKIKTRRLELFLEQFVNKISNYSSTIILDSEGYPCVVNDFIRSELIDEYQSQNEFLINIDVNKSIAVGLIIGNFKEGKVTCIRPSKFIVCKKSHRLLAEKFEKYLKDKSKLRAILDFKTGEGNWLSFFVRSNEKGEHQCLAKLNDQKLTNEILDQEKVLLKEYFESISDEFKIKSFNLEVESTCKNVQDNLIHESRLDLIFGNPYLPVKFNEKIYNITARSLFPLNVEVYLKMINLLIENLDLVKTQNLIFVSPFSGLGLPEIAKSINTLFVLDKTLQNSSNCKKGLEHLLIKNLQFSYGSPMKGIFKILDSNSQEILIIIRQEDLNFQILNELRANRYISKIALISTKPQESLLKIWIQLSLDKTNKIGGKPFNFISATPIDTHPHSNIYTIVSIFERIIN